MLKSCVWTINQAHAYVDFVALNTTVILCSHHYRPLLALLLHAHLYFSHFIKVKHEADTVSSIRSICLLHSLQGTGLVSHIQFNMCEHWISPLLSCAMGSPKGKLYYGCVSGGEPEVREQTEFKSHPSHPRGQSGSPPASPHLRGPWGEDPQVVMVTKSFHVTQPSVWGDFQSDKRTLTYLGFWLILQRHRRPRNTSNL